MQLLVSNIEDEIDEIVAEETTEAILLTIFNSIDWKTFHFITLRKDDGNWLEVSGRLPEDGLAIVFEENGEEFISTDAPTLENAMQCLLYYLKDDARFKELVFSSRQESKPATIKLEGWWKAEFDLRRAEQKRRTIFGIVMSVIIVGSISLLIYYWSIDELRFVGHQTETVNGIVTSSEWVPARGGYKQLVKYKFIFKQKDYEGAFMADQFTGKHIAGDSLEIKFIIDSPQISKRIKTLR